MKPVHRQKSLRRSLAGAGVVALIAAGGGTALVASAAPGSSAPSAAPSASPSPQSSLTDASAQPEGAFVAVTPLRVLDTRPAPYGPIGVTQPSKLGSNSTMDLRLSGDGFAVPANATAVQLNITINDDASQPSYLTVWPKGETRPNTSANNALPGMIASNSMLAKLGKDGSISIYNQQGAVNVVIDVVGYLVPMPEPAPDGAATAYSTTAAPLTITGVDPAPIAFGAQGPAAGSVQRRDASSFTVTDNGLYTVSYDIEFDAVAAGSVSVFVNGVAKGPAVPVAAGTSVTVSDDALVAVPVNGVVDVRFTPAAPGAAVTVGSASVVVTQSANMTPST